MTITDKVKRKIWDLYFERLYSISQILHEFDGKLTYGELKKVINEKYK